MENILVKCTTSDENPKIVSFPSGVPQLIQHMELIGKVKGTGKKRKYHLEGDMNGLKFEGFDYGNHNPSYDLNSYAVGIYDEKRNSITLQPVHHIFAMNVIHANRDNIPQMNTSLSNYDRKHDLTEAFGSKKKKRAMKQQESNTISSESITGASALHDAVGIVASNNSDNVDDPTSTMDAASQALAAHRELMLPVHNMNATTLAEAYPPKDLYSGAVHHALKEWIEKMANEVAGLADSTPPLSRWKEVLHQRAIPEICLELIDSLYAAKVTSSGDTVGLKAFQKSLRLIIYLSSMMRLCECLISNSKDRPVARDVITTFLGDAPVALLRYLTDSFSTHKKVNGVHSFQATKTHADKLLMHLLIVCLHCMGGSIDLTRLSEYLKISVTRLTSLSREVGCTVLLKKTTTVSSEDQPTQSTADRHTAQISLPLKFPERRKGKSSKR